MPYRCPARRTFGRISIVWGAQAHSYALVMARNTPRTENHAHSFAKSLAPPPRAGKGAQKESPLRPEYPPNSTKSRQTIQSGDLRDNHSMILCSPAPGHPRASHGGTLGTRLRRLPRQLALLHRLACHRARGRGRPPDHAAHPRPPRRPLARRQRRRQRLLKHQARTEHDLRAVMDD